MGDADPLSFAPAPERARSQVGDRAEATFYTVSDARFFVGTVALVNSLRLTGHDNDIVVLDRGLRPEQRSRLTGHVSFAEVDADLSPMLCKPYPYLVGAVGTVVVIDSDMIVTGSLARTIGLAERGRICLYPDVPEARARWFDDWASIFELRAPLRRQTFMNSGFVAFSTWAWPELLERWWRACERHPRPYDVTLRHALATGLPDQDALNALLMSELPPDAVEELPDREAPLPPRLAQTEVVDTQSLGCRFDGYDVALLHYTGRPKPWERSAWTRVARDSYVRLLPRVLFGADVAVRVSQTDVPYWLRPTVGGAGVLRVLNAAQRFGRIATAALPESGQRRLRSWRSALSLRRGGVHSER